MEKLFFKLFKAMMKHFRVDLCKVQTLIKHFNDSFRGIYTREARKKYHRRVQVLHLQTLLTMLRSHLDLK